MDPPQPQPQAAKLDDLVWEFVTCAKCQLAFSPEGRSGPSTPFWITECGHVLCNSHLNPDRSCPSCKEQDIELMPLQKDMPSPFSEWFSPLPYRLDALAQAAKFQQERIAGAARFWKNRCAEYQAVLTRCKEDLANMKALRNEVKMLQVENARLRRDSNGGQTFPRYEAMVGSEPSQHPNANRKRPMEEVRTSLSSPRIHVAATPLGPPRITRHPNHDAPPSLARLNGSDVSSGSQNGQQRVPTAQPPGSSHFRQQYAFNSIPQTADGQMRQRQVLSHAQQAPVRQRMQANGRSQMPPPPTPMHGRQQQLMQTHAQHASIPQQQPTQQPTPGPSHRMQQYGMKVPRTREAQGQAPQRFVPPSFTGNSVFVPPTPSGTSRRFVPSTPSHSNGKRYNGSGFG